MKPLLPHEFNDSPVSKIIETASEICDNRFAVVSERLYEVVSYNDCSNGHNYDILTVHTAEGAYAPDHEYEPVPQQYFVYVDDEIGSAHAMFIALLQERLLERCR